MYSAPLSLTPSRLKGHRNTCLGISLVVVRMQWKWKHDSKSSPVAYYQKQTKPKPVIFVGCREPNYKLRQVYPLLYIYMVVFYVKLFKAWPLYLNGIVSDYYRSVTKEKFPSFIISFSGTQDFPCPQSGGSLVSGFFNARKPQGPSHSPFLKCAQPNLPSWPLTCFLHTARQEEFPPTHSFSAVRSFPSFQLEN